MEDEHRPGGNKTQATHTSTRQAELPAKSLEHNEELHRQGSVQDPNARELLGATEYVTATHRGL